MCFSLNDKAEVRLYHCASEPSEPGHEKGPQLCPQWDVDTPVNNLQLIRKLKMDRIRSHGHTASVCIRSHGAVNYFLVITSALLAELVRGSVDEGRDERHRFPPQTVCTFKNSCSVKLVHVSFHIALIYPEKESPLSRVSHGKTPLPRQPRHKHDP